MAAIHELDKGSFGRFLAQLRRERGLTQRDLAEMLFNSRKSGYRNICPCISSAACWAL